MDNPVAAALLEMVRRNRGDQKRIEHSLKVYGYARLLGQMEGLSPEKMFVLELTAILHDIGIHVSEAKYGYSDGRKQEIEGPPVAREILENIPVGPEVVDRVCFIVSKHHTFSAIDGLDFQLLVEADFLVNSVEEAVSPEGVQKFVALNFKTESGRKLIGELFAQSL
ncbi:MAG: HD domain-containing protein [Bacteroidetes bacterium]|nr:HD domain-containing protein [Bacteroidota bacterium]